MTHARIRSVSRRFAGLCIALLLLTPLVMIAYWALMPADLVAGTWIGDRAAVVALSWPRRLAAMGLTALGLLPLAWCLAALHRLFALYAEGTIFDAANVAAFNGIGVGLIGFGAAQIAAPTAIPLLLTFDNPVGQRILVLGIGTGALEALILGGVIRLIGWVMDEARTIADEQALTV